MSIWLFFVPLLQLFFWFEIGKKSWWNKGRKEKCMYVKYDPDFILKLHVCVYSESEKEENLFISGG